MIGMAMKNVYPLPTKNVYIACLDWRFDWEMDEVKVVEKMWKEGKSISDIAKVVKRNTNEVAVLIMDRAAKGKIKKRPGGVFGRED